MRTPLEAVRVARGHVRTAIGLSRGANLTDLVRASEFLHNAGDELRLVEEGYRGPGIADPNGKFRAEMKLLKREMAVAGRVIDAGASLHRGLLLRLSGARSVYSPGGSSEVAGIAKNSVEIRG